MQTYPIMERFDMESPEEFDRIIDRRHEDNVKWRKYPEDVLPMWVADMDFASPEAVVNALRQRVEHSIFGYPAGVEGRANNFRLVIVERMQRLYGWQIEPDDIFLLPGVVTGFHVACHAFGSPQRPVMVQTPVYHPILHAAHETGIAGREMELQIQPDGTYQVDWDLFEAHLAGRPSASSSTDPLKPGLFILCNPHNPIGKVFSAAELERTAQACLRSGVVICSDEIHCDLIYSGHKHIPIAALDSEVARQTITLMAPSKTFNIAGLQCSFAIIQNPELRKRYLEARKGLVPWVNLMGTLAGEVAYQHGQEWLGRLLVYLEANRNFLAEYVSQNLPGVRMGLPQGTYLAWLDFRQVENPELRVNPYQHLLDKGRLAVNNGGDFGQGGQGFVRLNFGCPRALLEDGLERIRKAL
jgi:cysteine-S-conjugate beta-lyase